MGDIEQKKLRILITGFGPFAGRELNGSWLTAREFCGQSLVCNGIRCELMAIQCNVVWNAPTQEILPVVELVKPDVLISFGEAVDDFRIECIARNERGEGHRDNLGKTRAEDFIRPDGPTHYPVCFDAERVKKLIDSKALDVPVVLSRNAGQFLCDEMYYTMQHHRQSRTAESPMLVAFIHIPVFGRPIQRVSDSSQSQKCDEVLLKSECVNWLFVVSD
jgi:pyroglutamyl-peptidase